MLSVFLLLPWPMAMGYPGWIAFYRRSRWVVGEECLSVSEWNHSFSLDTACAVRSTVSQIIRIGHTTANFSSSFAPLPLPSPPSSSRLRSFPFLFPSSPSAPHPPSSFIHSALPFNPLHLLHSHHSHPHSSSLHSYSLSHSFLILKHPLSIAFSLSPLENKRQTQPASFFMPSLPCLPTTTTTIAYDQHRPTPTQQQSWTLVLSK